MPSELGIGIQQINKLNAADIFALVAQRIGEMPPSSERTSIALKLADAKQRQGSNGKSITDIIITTVATDMARGGKTAQTMANQYGLTRQGRPTG